MATIGEILIGMKVDSNGLTKGLKSGSSSLGSFGTMLSTTKGNVIALGAAVAAVGTGAFASWVTSSIDAINTQGDLSAQLGLSTSALQQLQAAALATGSDSETMNASLSKLQLTLGEAQSGSGAAAAAFGTLGLSAQELLNLPVEEQFKAISGALAGISNNNEQAALTADIFGKANLGLLNTINAGTDALEQNKAAALATGFALSDVDNTKIADAQDALDQIGWVVTALGNKLAADLAPAITAVAGNIASFGKDFLSEGSLISDSLHLVGAGLSTVIGLTEDLYSAGKGIAGFMRDPLETIANLVVGTNKADASMRSLNEDASKLDSVMQNIETSGARATDVITAIGLSNSSLTSANLYGIALKNITTDGDKASGAVAKIGKDLDEKVVEKLRDSIRGLFEELDKRISEFGKSKFKIGQGTVQAGQDAVRQKIITAGKKLPNTPENRARIDKALLRHDQETAQLMSAYREKSRKDLMNDEKKAADEKKKLDEAASKALIKNSEDKKNAELKSSRDSLLKTLEGPEEIFAKSMQDIITLNNTKDENGKPLLSDSEFEKLRKSLTSDLEEGRKEARNKDYDKKLKALEDQKNMKKISSKTFDKNKLALDKEFGVIPDLQDDKSSKPDFKLTGLAELGSNAARETILANRFGGNNDLQKSAVDIAKQQLGTMKELNKHVAKLNISQPLKGKKIA